MASIDLLEEARAKGLEIRIDGEQLVVRGPRAARPVAEALLASKTEILAAIRLGQEHRVWLDSLSLADRLRYDRAFGRTWAAGCDTEPCRRMAGQKSKRQRGATGRPRQVWRTSPLDEAMKPEV